jgi:hypothetical protein
MIMKAVEVDFMEPGSKPSLRKARLLGIIFLIYAIVLPFVVLLVPESELPASTGPVEAFSWLLIFLMPVDILLIYVTYCHLGKKSESGNIMGPAILMYMFAVAPSIYGFLIGFIGSAVGSIAIPVGLTISLVGFGLAWMLLSKLWENIHTSDDY